MSDAAIIALIGTITVLFTQVGTVWGLWLKAREAAVLALAAKSAADTAALAASIAATDAAFAAVRADATAVKVDKVAETTETIHTLSNSVMSEVREELRQARTEIRQLQQLRVEQAMATPKMGSVAGDATVIAVPALPVLLVPAEQPPPPVKESHP